MGMEEGGGDRKCFPRAWGIPPKPCDSCKLAAALVFCRVDSAFLCIACDLKTHGLGNTRHEHVWMCEVCEQAPASVTCKADAAALCVTCDRDIHSANPLARRHERIPVAPFYDTAESVVKSAATSAASLLLAGGEATGIADQETAPVSWVIPDPIQKLPADPTEMKSIDFLFSDTEQFLDFEYPIGIHNSGTDSVVPVQPMKYVQPAAQEMINPSPDNYVENDFSSSKFNSYTNSSSYTAQSLSHSFSSSSMDVGVVPDGSCMSEISFPFGRITNNNVDLSVAVNIPPCQRSDREARVLRYREKKKNRKFEKMIRYASRKAYAETRPRIKGRFAKRGEADSNMLNRSFTSSSCFMAESRFVANATGYGVVPSFL